RPLVMVLDDLQWARPISVRFIENVLVGQGVPGLLLVAAFRPEELGVAHPLTAVMPRWERLERAPVQLRLANLPPADLGALLGEMLRLPASQAAALADAVGAHTGGNPYDTVELVNALRRDGALVPGPQGWDWDAGAIHRFIGQGNVLDLLAARIARLPPPERALLEAVACLGGEVGLSLLQAATGLPASVLEQQLAEPIEEGLLALDRGDDKAVRLAHDRVQQAAYGALGPAQRDDLHLALARRLAMAPEFDRVAAEQYLAAVAALVEPHERRRAAGLFREAAAHQRRGSNSATEERFLTAAISLRDGMDSAADEALFAELEIEQHAVLYKLGRLAEADGVYQAIEARRPDVLALVDATCVQVASLSNRGRPHEAVALGMSLLRQLGLEVPATIAASGVDRQMEVLHRWVEEFSQADEQARPEASDPRVVAAAKLINRLQAPAFFCDLRIVAWLVLESRRLWAEHGPCPALVANLSRVTLVSIAMRQDYRVGYEAIRHVLGVSQARGYGTETAQTRHLFAISTAHWFEPLENSIGQARQAREGLLLGGDLQNACFTYRSSIAALLDCAPTLDPYATEIEAGLALAERTGNAHAAAVNLADRQLLRSLRGQTEEKGGFGDSGFDEAAHLAVVGDNPMAVVSFHIRRALAAALFGDRRKLQHHALAAQPLLSYIQGFYPTAVAHLLHALALAEQVRAAAPGERAAVLADLDASRDWMAARAADAPSNFLHLVNLIEAERAWALEDFEQTARRFDGALRAVEARQRPWHRDLITERAGLFHLTHGMERTGEMLLIEALRLYRDWGASAKVEQLEDSYRFLHPTPGDQSEREAGRGGASVDTIDMLAILRVSQALSSETSLARLQTQVVELLGALTGATTVRFALWHEDAKDWFLPATADSEPIPVEQAAARGLLPLSAFRYAQRTQEPLLVDDAAHDDRFARDPYLAGLRHCSLLVVPILNQGTARAILLLENRLSLGAFSTERLDAVMLIAGQLAVSLENALLYEKLEQRVLEQTRELRDTQTELVAAARRAGMAEIATNVLHNVGNVLNSVTVSAGVVGNTLRKSRAQGLSRAVQLMERHSSNLGHFLTADDKGKLLPAYLSGIAQTVAREHQTMLEELNHLGRSIDHIKDVVSLQQSYAGGASLVELVQIRDLAEDALRMNADALTRHRLTVVKQFAQVPEMLLDRARVLQILVNLISNAKNATTGAADGRRQITLRVDIVDASRLRVRVEDQGEGIPAENLTRIFAHGFTTRKTGHGFGLHSCALAAKQMGGTLTAHSDGPGQGATF
ncbi:MAG TPA: ATP-binding protein, partial [Ramlibacter sp.]|nr:ATP-binding protein [Ramlibacter sp.]